MNKRIQELSNLTDARTYNSALLFENTTNDILKTLRVDSSEMLRTD